MQALFSLRPRVYLSLAAFVPSYTQTHPSTGMLIALLTSVLA